MADYNGVTIPQLPTKALATTDYFIITDTNGTSGKALASDLMDQVAEQINDEIQGIQAVVDDIYDQFAGKDEIGTYDANANLCTIRNAPGTDVTFTPDTTPDSTPEQANGKSFRVNVPGTSDITGVSIDMVSGGSIISRGAKWDYIPFEIADGVIGMDQLTNDLKDLTGKNVTYGRIGDKEIIFARRDSNGDVVYAEFIDGSNTNDYSVDVLISNGLTVEQVGKQFRFKYGTIEGSLPFGGGSIKVLSSAFVGGKQVLYVVEDSEGDVVEAYFIDGTKFSMPYDIGALISEVTTARGAKGELNNRISKVISAQSFPTTPVWGGETLKRWHSWKRMQDYRYDLCLIGDSYTQGGYYSGSFFTYLLGDGYLNGGAGYCGFSRFGDTLPTFNQAIDTRLSINYTVADWAASAGGFGIEGYITSSVANTVATLTSTQATGSVTIIYEKHAGGGDFRWRINAGSWTTVSTANATQSIGNVVIDTSGSGSSFTISVEAMAIGVILCGAIARNSGNVLNVHKCGISGGTAALFGTTDLWNSSINLLTPRGVVIMFGTNEHSANILPDTYKNNIQNIISRVRTFDPMCDIILGVPTFTRNETEIPKTYSLKDYAGVLFELAQENNCAFINHSAAMGSFSQSLIDSGFMHSDRVHPGAKGGVLIADNFYSLLKK